MRASVYVISPVTVAADAAVEVLMMAHRIHSTKNSMKIVSVTKFGHDNNIPTKQFSVGFPEVLSQNLICYH